MRELAQALRVALDPVVFAQSLGFTSDPWQAKVLRSGAKRLLINASRQTGKSTTVSKLALHTAIYKPNALILLVSPSLRQSGELFKKVTEDLNRLPNKPELDEDSKTSLKFANGSRIVSLPGSEETIRGFSGATLIVEDEASRVDDALYYSIRPMLAASAGRLILMSTPFGRRGHYYTEWSGQNNWERVKIPATECPRISAEFLAEERASLGDWWFRQEYLGEFCETTDSLFTYEQIKSAISTDVLPLFDDEQLPAVLPGISPDVAVLQLPGRGGNEG